ncbi:hypothetical protein DQ04_09741000, partial [Trypanosoma grayi]|uniref:hypothetical protein n=1 Tax=Trypanosoma grayi TaxID=71804 RepID=UPI0004F470C2
MGRNKKGKASDTHEAAATAEMENASFEQEVPDDSPASHTESDSSVVEEQPAPKKKAYHGNKLNRGAGGKAKKEEPVREPHPQTATAETNGAATPGEEQDEGDAVSGAAEQLEDGAAVARHEPVEVLYCPICTFPAEMCEYSGMYEQCRPWLLEHAKELAEAEERGRKRRALTERDRL